MPRKSKLPRDEAVSYAADILLKALRTGYADPILLVECVHYAAEPEVMAVARAFAALDERGRAEVTRIVHSLSRDRHPPSPNRRAAH